MRPSVTESMLKPEFDEYGEQRTRCPSGGAIGRGDAFVLTIADRAGASVLSNDSFQEFHGDYEWLFDEGRPSVGSGTARRMGIRRTHLFVGRRRERRRRNRPHQQQALFERQVSGRASPCRCRRIRRPVRQKGEWQEEASLSGEVRKVGEPVNDLIPFWNLSTVSRWRPCDWSG